MFLSLMTLQWSAKCTVNKCIVLMTGMLGTTTSSIARNTLGYDGFILGVAGNATQEDTHGFIECGTDDVAINH
jgi:hypothetical protein